MTRYKKTVRELIQDLIEGGRSRTEIADALGIAPRVISMVISSDSADRLAVMHLPALQELSGFSDELALKLLGMHTDDYDGCKLDKTTLKWLISCTWRESRRRGAGKGGPHAGR